MLLARLGSLNALEQTARSPLWKRTPGETLPSIDTISRVAGLLDPEEFREINTDFYHRLKRNKALVPPHHGLIALLIDGHESVASYRRSCPGCLERTIRTASGDQIQHYHRYVAASLVAAGDVHLFVDAEAIRPGEDEVAAAIRLLRRIHERMARSYDVVVADSLYARADFFHAVLDLDKDVLTVLKQEARELLVDARSLFETMIPETFVSGSTEYQVWDVERLRSWSSLNREVRLVRTIETTRVRRQLTKKRDTITSEWVWVTTLSATQASSRTIVGLGHSRWKIENEGFNEIVNAWHLDHVYRHDPKAMMVLLLLGMIAYNLENIFYRRDLKPARRERESLLTVSRRIAAAIYATLPEAHAPT
jgi:hypothetical protein